MKTNHTAQTASGRNSDRPRKILLTGATGFVGRHLMESWKQRNDKIFAIATNTAPVKSVAPAYITLLDMDIVDEMSVAILFEKIQPDIVVHTAAMTKPNDCEQDKESAFETNTLATKNIAECCKKFNSQLVFLSTDMIFDHPFASSESDDKKPVNYYGETKALAEEEIARSGCRAAILRIILVYGKLLKASRGTFLHWVKDSLEQDKEIFVYTDQHRNTLYVNDLCAMINHILDHGNTGFYHLAGEEIFTPYEIAVKVAEHLHLDTRLIHPVTSGQRPEIARRAAYSVLNTHKAKKELGFVPTPFDVALRESFD